MRVAYGEVMAQSCSPARVDRVLGAGKKIHVLALVSEKQAHLIAKVPVDAVHGLVVIIVVRERRGKVVPDARQRGHRIILPELLHDGGESARGNDVIGKR